MHVYVDESGDYAFGDTRFDSYVLAGVICPESELPAIEDFVASAARRWDVGELHGAQLNREQLVEICEFVGAASVSALVHVTDTQMMTKAVIRAFRLKQAEQIESELARWRAAGGSSVRVAADLTNLAKAARFTSRLSDTEFVQATMLPDLLRDVVQRSIDRFEGDEWRDAFERFEFVFDEKLPGKLSPGQKFANLMYMPVLGSNKRFVFDIPEHWRDTGHPYAVNFSDGSHTRVNALFANGLATRASHEIAGLQIADVIAHVVRQAVLRPNAIDRVLTAYDALRPALAGPEGRCLQIYRYESGNPPPRAVYQPLYEVGSRISA